jgi:cytoplasmic iron level regulating protein YaaA (DUF328/UPF0246 family)
MPGLEAGTLSEDALRYGQDHLRILSGLYGLCARSTRSRPTGWKWAAV